MAEPTDAIYLDSEEIGYLSAEAASGYDLTQRHSSTQQIVRHLSYDRLPEGPLRDASKLCHDMGMAQVWSLPDGPELTAGLRKLVEAKDCFVRQALNASEG